jgi:hypothetical protein
MGPDGLKNVPRADEDGSKIGFPIDSANGCSRQPVLLSSVGVEDVKSILAPQLAKSSQVLFPNVGFESGVKGKKFNSTNTRLGGSLGNVFPFSFPAHKDGVMSQCLQTEGQGYGGPGVGVPASAAHELEDAERFFLCAFGQLKGPL